ncbi:MULTISPECIES: hypothetical protein [unclassified Bacillus (in: firmicutes)]|uniref:hypothetical protein n=1 Tax=unclassified Bacillus (in: firmicutes) TaxID=185979 RepID=UPI00080AD267|nr:MULTISPECIES: hypothetical protein [unclassified Bacillus (in: firmicutes)]OCA89916.1 hypothetical protein A8L44_03010 [Bacillus sp. FJAT-27986]
MEKNEVIMIEERSNSKMNFPFILKIVVIIALLFTVITLGAGLYKLYVYESPYSKEEMIDQGYEEIFNEEKAVNAYNLYDVQNLSVNAGMATAYFTLAILFSILGIGAFVMAEILKRNEQRSMLSIDNLKE